MLHYLHFQLQTLPSRLTKSHNKPRLLTVAPVYLLRMDGMLVFAESLLLLCSGGPKLSLTSNDASSFVTTYYSPPHTTYLRSWTKGCLVAISSGKLWQNAHSSILTIHFISPKRSYRQIRIGELLELCGFHRLANLALQRLLKDYPQWAASSPPTGSNPTSEVCSNDIPALRVIPSTDPCFSTATSYQSTGFYTSAA